MIKDAEAILGPSAALSAPGPGRLRKPYQSPTLVDWGSLVELTRGSNFDVQDDDFSGSGGE